jgi:uncharacterized protein (TIGR03089 family)
MSVSLTDRLLGPILDDDAARPLITFYDDADGTRVELSATTLANWAAKTANWLRDECGLAAGDRVHIDLPAHWQTAGALLGAWWCGAHVVSDPAGAEVSLVAPGAAGEADAGFAAGRAVAPVCAVVALDPLGRGAADPPPGCVDWATEIRVHGDFFHPAEPVPGSTPALLGATIDQVHAAAHRRAADLGITAGARVLSTLDWDLPGGLLTGLLAVLAAPASLVHCAHPDDTALATRRSTEHVTVDLPENWAAAPV